MIQRTGAALTAILVTAVLAGALTPLEAASSREVPARASLVGGNTVFAVQLYRELASTKGNLFFSPLSISSALGMTYAGARGETEREMQQALHFELGQARLHAAFKGLNRELMRGAVKDGQQLNIANGLCLTGGEVSDDFKRLLQDNYEAEIFSGSLETINAWVKGKTEGRIPRILERLDPDSVCVLLNAIYFKGFWESRFDKRRTLAAPFSISADRQVKVPLMYQKGDFRLLAESDFQALALPYREGRLSMIVLLPQAPDGLASLEKRLTTENLAAWLAELDQGTVQELHLYLPKFKLETGYDLVPTCRQLGMHAAFDPGGGADFSGMGWPKGKLWISQIRHKAFVEVDEEGTEAAAATAVEMRTLALQQYPVFRADHPFLFLIRDNPTGCILFMGRVVDPLAG